MMRYFLQLSTISFLFFFWGCETDRPDTKEPGLTDGTAEMVAELKRIDSTAAPFENYSLNSRRAAMAEDSARLAQDPKKRMQWTYLYAYELLKAGKTKECIDVVRAILENYGGLHQDITQGNRIWFDLLAISYLRFAEQLNCAANHNAESCVLPIRGKGIHRIKKWSEYAVEMYNRILETFPEDQTARWLLNVAHQTLGTYPEAVPTRWLIPPTVFESERPEFPRFWDIAMKNQTAIDGLSGGSIMDDFNNDGWLDIFATSYGLLDQARVLLNQNGNGFEDITEQSGITGITSGLNTMQMDFNNDGNLDVFILRGGWLKAGGLHPNSLLMNTGDAQFIDVTKSSGLYSKHPTQTACWCDFDLDGWIDVFIGNESGQSSLNKSELFINKGDGTFSEQTAKRGVPVEGYVKGVTCGDINGDRRPDLYISMLGGTNMLFLNQKEANSENWFFKDVSQTAGIRQPVLSFPTWMFDYNQDGLLDIFVSGYDLRHFGDVGQDIVAEYLDQPLNTALPRLYKNNGNGTFTDVSVETGVNKVMYTMGCNFGDLNGDGYPDFYTGTGEPDFESIIPNRMFLNVEGKEFVEVTTPGGFGNLQKGHGVSFGDYDRDGDQDIYIVMGGAFEGDRYQNLFFENPIQSKSWIQLKLEGTTSNRAAIGAHVTITATMPDGQSRQFYHTVSSGASFGGNSLLVEAGLDDAVEIEQIKVVWPNKKGTTDIYKNPPLNKCLSLKEGESTFKTLY